MKTIMITGAAGFIGRNLVSHLKRNSEYSLLLYDVGSSNLEDIVPQADFIVHLAGVNRTEREEDFWEGNRDLTQQIVTILSQKGLTTPIALSSSIQAELDNPYGKSKLAAETCLREYASQTGAKVYLFRLTNVFGKWCRPNYNSVVATFCHHIANDLPITVSDPQKVLRLIHVDEVVKLFLAAIEGKLEPDPQGFCQGGKTFEVTLGDLAEKIKSFRQICETCVFPDFSEEFTRILYSVYLSYLSPQQMQYPLEMKTDPRGWLFECIKSPSVGQIFISKTKPGITRGNHFHDVKVEKFIVLQGEAQIRLRAIDQDEVLTYAVSGEQIQVVEIPPGMTHSITNVGETDLITLFWTPVLFQPDNPDTIYLPVLPNS